MIKNEFKIFLTAVLFYTRIPCPKWVDHSADYLNKSARYLPLIGWIYGGVSCFVLLLSLLLNLSPEIAVVLSMVSGILLTGAFHEDGFADVCDGFGGGWKKQKILDIMKDSRVGAYAVIGLVLLLLLKFLLILKLTNLILNSTYANPALKPIKLLFVLIVSHSLSRYAAISIAFTDTYAREDADSKSVSAVGSFTRIEILVGLFFTLLPLGFFAVHHLPILGILIPVILLRIYLASYFRKWIGGYTGDCLGAAQQICEVVIYLSFIALWNYI